MDKNRKLDRDIDRILSNIKKKYILTEDGISDLKGKINGGVVLPISIFNEKLSMLESTSLYFKDELNLSFKEITLLVKRSNRAVRRSYNKAKKKVR